MQGAVYEVARILVVPGIEDRARGITFRGSRSLYWRIAPARLQDFENAFAIADAPLVPLAPPEATQARNGACQNCRNTNSRPSFRGPALFSKLVACSGRSTKTAVSEWGDRESTFPSASIPQVAAASTQRTASSGSITKPASLWSIDSDPQQSRRVASVVGGAAKDQ
jgi:hypothetical protein